jgi:prophage maintenance system killer protein
LIRPSVGLAVAINRVLRQPDEWFEEPDDLGRISRAISVIDHIDDPIEAAAVLGFRVARAQAFGEANKRTAILLARWVLDRNGLDGSRLLPAKDRDVANLLIKAASDHDVESALVDLLRARQSR